MSKNFNDWNKIKKILDKHQNFLPIKEAEVWWCSVGVNVGVEMCGKNTKYSRPVLAQARMFSVNRITDRMGTLPQSDFIKIKRGFERLFCQ